MPIYALVLIPIWVLAFFLDAKRYERRHGVGRLGWSAPAWALAGVVPLIGLLFLAIADRRSRGTADATAEESATEPSLADTDDTEVAGEHAVVTPTFAYATAGAYEHSTPARLAAPPTDDAVPAMSEPAYALAPPVEDPAYAAAPPLDEPTYAFTPPLVEPAYAFAPPAPDAFAADFAEPHEPSVPFGAAPFATDEPYESVAPYAPAAAYSSADAYSPTDAYSPVAAYSTADYPTAEFTSGYGANFATTGAFAEAGDTLVAAPPAPFEALDAPVETVPAEAVSETAPEADAPTPYAPRIFYPQ